MAWANRETGARERMKDSHVLMSEIRPTKVWDMSFISNPLLLLRLLAQLQPQLGDRT
jgi:hypothetical protein